MYASRVCMHCQACKMFRTFLWYCSSVDTDWLMLCTLVTNFLLRSMRVLSTSTCYVVCSDRKPLWFVPSSVHLRPEEDQWILVETSARLSARF